MRARERVYAVTHRRNTSQKKRYIKSKNLRKQRPKSKCDKVRIKDIKQQKPNDITYIPSNRVIGVGLLIGDLLLVGV